MVVETNVCVSHFFSQVQNIIGKTKQSSWGHHVVTRASEELDISTAESTRSTENNNGEIDLPYSTVPAQNAIVNEADGATMVEDWGAVRTNLDVQSWGEDSFPILSNHATTFSLAGEEYSERPVRISIDSAQDSRVRFSGKVSVEKLAYEPNDSSGEIPWDEGGDVAVGVAEYTSSAMQDPPARLMTPQTKNDSSGQPKSILRPSRFSQQPNTSRFTHAARSLGKRVDDDSVATPLNPLNTSAVIKSPPRNGTGFLEHGIELSPIERAVTQAFGHPAEKGSAAAFQEIMRQANCLYPVGNVVEDGSLYSDPTLDVMNVSRHSQSFGDR